MFTVFEKISWVLSVIALVLSVTSLVVNLSYNFCG